MFDKCIKCPRLGESCVPNLMLLPFPELLKWWDKRQKYLGWTNQKLADNTKKIPVGTINRVKTSEEDCKFSTMQSVLITLIGGTTDEWSCTEQVQNELLQIENLERQNARLASTEAENERLKHRLEVIDELHRNDIRAIRSEYLEQIRFLYERIDFLTDELKERKAHSDKSRTNVLD